MKKISAKEKKSFQQRIALFLESHNNYFLIKKYESGNSFLLAKKKKLKVSEHGTKSLFQNLERTVEKEYFILFLVIHLNIKFLDEEINDFIKNGMNFIEWYDDINLLEATEKI